MHFDSLIVYFPTSYFWAFVELHNEFRTVVKPRPLLIEPLTKLETSEDESSIQTAFKQFFQEDYFLGKKQCLGFIVG